LLKGRVAVGVYAGVDVFADVGVGVFVLVGGRIGSPPDVFNRLLNPLATLVQRFTNEFQRLYQLCPDIIKFMKPKITNKS
jgi:hypothetical protein